MIVNRDFIASTEHLNKFESQIGIVFENKGYLIEALLHKSYFSGDSTYSDNFAHANNLHSPNYEKLEFLGDSILGAIISDHFYADGKLEIYANAHEKSIEGTLTDVKKVLVSNKQLKPLAKTLNLDEYILCNGLSNIADIYDDVIEALIGAIFRDKGYDGAKEFVFKYFNLEGALGKIVSSNPIGDVKEYCDANYWGDPEYKVIGETGPDHQKHFTVELYSHGKFVSIGYGSKIKIAQADAARKYLEIL